jgi:hypothetical protein
MVLVYEVIPFDLTPVGGPANGYIFDSIVQEVDIATGDLLFEWKSSEHVPLNESYNALLGHGTQALPYDYFHVNSAAKDADGNYLISGRTMDCMYKLNGTDGSIIWHMGGKVSDFDVAPEAAWALQHDARWIDDKVQSRMTLFANGPTASLAYSRGLLLDVDQAAKTVRLVREFTNAAKTFGQFQGSLQAINPSDPATNYILGYGSQPYFAEFNSEGDILLDVVFARTNAVSTYRTYKLPWVGNPLTVPDMVNDSQAKRVYLSWNGATAVETWGVYTSQDTGDGSAWTSVLNVTRTGFETTVELSASAADLQTYVRGQAFDVNGTSLGWSRAGDGRVLVDAETPAPPATSTSAAAAAPSETKQSESARNMVMRFDLYALLASYLIVLISV